MTQNFTSKLWHWLLFTFDNAIHSSVVDCLRSFHYFNCSCLKILFSAISFEKSAIIKQILSWRRAADKVRVYVVCVNVSLVRLAVAPNINNESPAPFQKQKQNKTERSKTKRKKMESIFSNFTTPFLERDLSAHQVIGRHFANFEENLLITAAKHNLDGHFFSKQICYWNLDLYLPESTIPSFSSNLINLNSKKFGNKNPRTLNNHKHQDSNHQKYILLFPRHFWNKIPQLSQSLAATLGTSKKFNFSFKPSLSLLLSLFLSLLSPFLFIFFFNLGYIPGAQLTHEELN